MIEDDKVRICSSFVCVLCDEDDWRVTGRLDVVLSLLSGRVDYRFKRLHQNLLVNY